MRVGSNAAPTADGRFHPLAALLPEPLLLVGADRVVDAVNRGFLDSFGWRREDIVGRDILTFVSTPAEEVAEYLRQCRGSAQFVLGRVTLRRPDGAEESCRAEGAALPPLGVPARPAVVLRLTRTASASVRFDDLGELRRQAEAADRAKDEFLAMLGHELRNPLSPILTALELMKLRGAGGFERERAIIERQVSHLTRLVDDLLDVARISRGKIELKQEIVEMGAVVAQALETASPLMEPRGHVCEVQVSSRDLTVRGDRTRLAQIVANLVTNAAKYTPTGGRVRVSVEADGHEIVLRVRDSGIGIAPDVLPRVFDPFFQERQALDRAHGGLGLGLTIVRNLVEGHGGSVLATSDGPGCGSEFIVRLPKANAAHPAAERRATPGAARVVEPSLLSPRVLIVDDNRDSAELLAEALGRRGYRTRVALDAPSALRLAEEFGPEMAVLDIGLPVMDGYELAGRLRRIDGLAAIRLVAVTGYGQPSDRRKTRAAGFEYHLVKPVDLNEIEAVLASAADGLASRTPRA